MTEARAPLAETEALVSARGLSFRYHEQVAPVLRSVDFEVRRGDAVLLEGPSGGGKSTLASLLTGVRRPSGGSLLLRGFDQRTLGSEAWRRLIAAAPQFHENYVFSGTLAFNLLMGRSWPPELEDLEAAERLCHELGLEGLLQRMPAGIMQIVGESGWQLSHGERSRIFLARALLQNAQLVVLDETFAALDPENLARALVSARRHAPSLLLIAHP